MFDEDIFRLSGEDDVSVPMSNPVTEHLNERLFDVRCRIENAKRNIEETETTTESILKLLHARAQYEDSVTSDDDDDADLYTEDGQPRIKRRKQKTHRQILIPKDSWKRVLCDKWVIGVVLQNTSTEHLHDIRFYIDAKNDHELTGSSILWYLADKTSYIETDSIPQQAEVVATIASDLPKFEEESERTVSGTISYRADGRDYQTPVPNVRLSAVETAEDSCGLDFWKSPRESMLALRSICLVKTVGIDIETDTARGTKILECLQELCFQEICSDVYVVEAAGSLMYCLIEVLPLIDEEAQLRISCRSDAQMNVMLRILKDKFPDMIVKEENNCVLAARTLMEELKLYLYDTSGPEKQRARIKTDLLIP